MLRQLRYLYTKSNRLLRLLHCCSTDVNIALYFAATVLVFIVFSYGHSIKNQLTVS